MSDKTVTAGAAIHVLSPYALTLLCGAEAFDSALLLSVGHPDSYAGATCPECLKAAPEVKAPELPAARAQPRPQPLRHNDTLGRAGRIADEDKRVKVERKREMTEEDRRRILLEGADPQSAHLEVVAPGPLVDETGEPLKVVRADDHRKLPHLDGNSEARPPAEWEDLESDFRHAVHVNTREETTARLRAERAATPIYERLHAQMRLIGTFQTQRARTMPENELDAIRGTGDKRQAPQGESAEAIGGAEAETVACWLQMIALLVERIEDHTDAHRGLASTSYVLMSQEDKDALLTGKKLRGLTPAMVHAIFPELGVPRTMQNIRRLSGQDARGNERPAVAA